MQVWGYHVVRVNLVVALFLQAVAHVSWLIVDVHNVVARAVVEQVVYVVGPTQFQECGVLSAVVVVFVVAG